MRFSLSPLVLGLVIVGSAIVLAGCNQNRAVPAADVTPLPATDTTTSPQADSAIPSDTVAIEIRNFEYAPGTVTVKPGQTVQVTNFDSMQHDVVSRDGVSFRTDVLDEGETGSFVAPDQPGTYEYYCSFHPQMVATLIVEE